MESQNYFYIAIHVANGVDSGPPTRIWAKDIADNKTSSIGVEELKLGKFKSILEETTRTKQTSFDQAKHSLRWKDYRRSPLGIQSQVSNEEDFQEAIQVQTQRGLAVSSLFNLDFEFFLPREISKEISKEMSEEILNYENATITIETDGVLRRRVTGNCSAITSPEFAGDTISAQDLLFDQLRTELELYAQYSGIEKYNPDPKTKIFGYCILNSASQPTSFQAIGNQEDFLQAVNIQSKDPSQDKSRIQLGFRLAMIPDPGGSVLFIPNEPKEVQPRTPENQISSDTNIYVTADDSDINNWEIEISEVTGSEDPELSIDDLEFGKFVTAIVAKTENDGNRRYDRSTDEIWSKADEITDEDANTLNFSAWIKITSDRTFRREVLRQIQLGVDRYKFDFTRRKKYIGGPTRGVPAKPTVPNSPVPLKDEPTGQKRKRRPEGPSPPKSKRAKHGKEKRDSDDEDDEHKKDAKKPYLELSVKDLEEWGEEIDRKKKLDEEDYMGDFDAEALMNTWESKACEHFTEELWLQCCLFFKHKEKNRKQKLDIDGFTGPKGDGKVHQHQAFAAFWMLTQGPKTGGGYLGDHMGLGKTRTILLLVCAQVWVNAAFEGLEKDREDPNSKNKHLKPGRQNEGDKCPSDRFNICCPCVESGPTASLERKHGPQLILVPPGLIGNWRSEFENAVSPEEYQPSFSRTIKLWIEHQSATGGLSQQQRQVLKCTLCKQTPKVQHNECQPDPAQDGIIVLSSSQSYYPRIEENSEFKVEHKVKDKQGRIMDKVKVETRTGKTVQKPPTRVGIPWAVAIADEAHNAHEIESKTTAPSLISRARGNPYVWAVSGTPIKSSPMDIGSWLEVVGKCRLKPEDAAKPISHIEKIKELDKSHEVLVNKFKNLPEQKVNDPEEIKKLWKEMREISNKLNGIIYSQTIRRVAETKWRGEPIAKLPEMSKKNVYVEEIEEEWKTKMKRFVKEAENEQESTNSKEEVSFRRLRMMATIPALADPVFEELEMTGEELNEKGWYNNHQESPYYEHLDMIYASSPKLKLLKHFLRKLVEGGTSKMQGKPNEPERKDQILISSAFPVISYIVWLWIKRRFKKPGKEEGNKTLSEQTEIIYNGMSLKTKNNIMFAFQNDITTSKADPNVTVPVENKCRVLVSTNGVIGVGFTLNRAHRVILMEPDWLTATEEQVFARVHRIGGMNKTTWARRIIQLGDVRETTLVQKQTATNVTTEQLFDPGAKPPPKERKKPLIVNDPESSPEKPSPRKPRRQKTEAQIRKEQQRAEQKAQQKKEKEEKKKRAKEAKQKDQKDPAPKRNIMQEIRRREPKLKPKNKPRELQRPPRLQQEEYEEETWA